MKPMGKAMKIGNANHKIENETLNPFLVNYRDIPPPHPQQGSPQQPCFSEKGRNQSYHAAKQQMKQLGVQEIKTLTAKKIEKLTTISLGTLRSPL